MIKNILMNKHRILLIGLFLMLTATASICAKDYKASMFGVKSDGVTLNTRSIQRAIDFISEQGGGTLTFYVGRYLTGSIELKSNVMIKIEEGAALVSVPSAYDYVRTGARTALIVAKDQKNIGVCGKGLIEGNSIKVAESVNNQMGRGYLEGVSNQNLPSVILFDGCEGAKIDLLTINNSCNTALIIDDCTEVEITNFTVNNTASNAAAIEIEGCKNVKMENCYWDTKVKALQSKDSSSGLTFLNCIMPDGVEISSEK